MLYDILVHEDASSASLVVEMLHLWIKQAVSNLTQPDRILHSLRLCIVASNGVI